MKTETNTWISVKDAMPDEKLIDKVFALYTGKKIVIGNIGINFSAFGVTQIFINENDNTIRGVTHWMLLSKPTETKT